MIWINTASGFAEMMEIEGGIWNCNEQAVDEAMPDFAVFTDFCVPMFIKPSDP